MTWSLVPLWLPLALAPPLAGGLACLIQINRPNWSNSRVAFLAALPGFLVIVALGIWAFAYIATQPPAPDEIDEGGMALAAIVFVTPVYALIVFVVGMLAGWLSIRIRKW